jgi:hypothetical protein
LNRQIDWILKNQLGRRNLTRDQWETLLGRLYNREKKAEGRPEKLAQNEQVSGDTATRLAEEYKVSRASVVRAGQFVEAADTPALKPMPS